MKPELSIIIAYHNEGQAFIEETVNQIMATIDIDYYEIIIVDDYSSQPIYPIYNARIIRQKSNLGVGQALRRGIWEAKSDNIWFQGADIRFIPNGWASKMLKEIDEHPTALSCATCIGINKDDMDIAKRRNRSRRNGANILIFHDHKTHPKKPENFRNILEAQWLPVNKVNTKSYEAPCILGASYGAKKEWLQHIDPTLLFNEYDADRLISFLGKNPQVNAGRQMFEENKKAILKKREEYEKKIVYDVRDYVKKWNIDFREDKM